MMQEATLLNGDKRIFLTHPTRVFRVPPDWSEANLIECVGGGCPDGGGGAYAASSNLRLVRGSDIDVTISPGTLPMEDTIFGGIVVAASASDYQGAPADNCGGEVLRSGGNGFPGGGGGGAGGPDGDGLSATDENGGAANGGNGGAGGISGPGEVGTEWGDLGTGGGGSRGCAGGAYGGGGGTGAEGAPGLIILTYTPA